MLGIHLKKPKEVASPAYRQALSELRGIKPEAAEFLARHPEYIKEAAKLDAIQKNSVAGLKTYRMGLNELERRVQQAYVLNKLQDLKHGKDRAVS